MALTRLDGQIAVVTGASRGLGYEIARGLASCGAHVVAVDVDDRALAASTKRLRSSGMSVEPHMIDVSCADQCERLFEKIGDDNGSASIIVNNAGICPRLDLASPNFFMEVQRAFSVNCLGALNVTRAARFQLAASKGCVVNIASIAAFISTGTSAAYSVSKAALVMATKTLAQELGPSGIRVNAIAPGPFATEMTQVTRANPVRRKSFIDRIFLGRFGNPEEIVGPTLFLCSDQSSFVTGHVLVVDGGFTAN